MSEDEDGSTEQETVPEQVQAESEPKIDVEEPVQTELKYLKTKAKMMGVKHHPSIGLNKLRDKIAEHTIKVDAEKRKEARQAKQTDVLRSPVEALQVHAAEVVPLNQAPVENAAQRRGRLRKEASKLVRIRITCMNPNKRDWEGEVFTVSNGAVGTFKKFVPFDNVEGWHVPQMILNMIQERKCQIFITQKNDRGMKVRIGKLINEFSVEIMSPLTGTELQELATQQAMANNIG